MTDDIAKILQEKAKELATLINRTIPIKAGRIAKDHFQDNFRRGGFVDNGLKPWPKTRRQMSGGLRASSQYGPLLSGRNHLFSSITYKPGQAEVTLENNTPYAAIHNDGGTINVPVTAKMKRFAWAKYYEASGKKRTKNGKTRSRRKPLTDNEVAEAEAWKRLALTKKTSLRITIPQRQFMGDSRELREKLQQMIEKELMEIMNK